MPLTIVKAPIAGCQGGFVSATGRPPAASGDHPLSVDRRRNACTPVWQKTRGLARWRPVSRLGRLRVDGDGHFRLLSARALERRLDEREGAIQAVDELPVRKRDEER